MINNILIRKIGNMNEEPQCQRILSDSLIKNKGNTCMINSIKDLKLLTHIALIRTMFFLDNLSLIQKVKDVNSK